MSSRPKCEKSPTRAAKAAGQSFLAIAIATAIATGTAPRPGAGWLGS